MYRFRLVLLPFSFLFLIAIALKNLLYKIHLFRERKSKIPVICVGNLSTGGSGKTPILMQIAKELNKNNKKLAVLSRGYKRETKGFLEVTNLDHRKYGDEPVMMRRILNDTDIYVCEDRFEAVRQISLKKNYDYILMDDGFQNRKIKKDFSIIIMDENKKSLLNKFLLPAGNLRETKHSLKRANAVITNYKFDKKRKEENSKYTAQYKFEGIISSENNKAINTTLKDKKFFVFCGIGDPSSFINLLDKLQLSINGKEVFPDHYNFSKTQIEVLIKKAKDSNCTYMLTTEKDFVRLFNFKEQIKANGLILCYIKIVVEIESFQDLMNEIYQIKRVVS